MTEKEKEYFEILMEEMNGKFSLVLEGHAAIRKEFKDQINGIKEEQQLFRSLLKGSHDELKAELQAADKRSEVRDKKLDVKIEGVREDLREEMAAGFEVLGDKMNGMDGRDSALGQKVEGHEDRIRFLERKVA